MRPFLPTQRAIRSISILSGLFASTTKQSNMSSSPPTYTTRSYTPKQPPPAPFPYSVADTTPMDPSSDSHFYSQPRFVTHIDDNAIISLRQYYDQFLPKKGAILDFCSSWISHYPPRIEESVESEEVIVLGTGMNEAELRKNLVLNLKGPKWVVQDLNADPNVRLPEVAEKEGVKLDAATCVVSIDYLTKPVEVLESIRKQTSEGGTVHLVVSNRCFPTKVVGRWLKVSEEERLNMVGDYLWWSGWKGVEIVEVVKGGGWLKDPLWVVRGRNVKE